MSGKMNSVDDECFFLKKSLYFSVQHRKLNNYEKHKLKNNQNFSFIQINSFKNWLFTQNDYERSVTVVVQTTQSQHIDSIRKRKKKYILQISLVNWPAILIYYKHNFYLINPSKVIAQTFLVYLFNDYHEYYNKTTLIVYVLFSKLEKRNMQSVKECKNLCAQTFSSFSVNRSPFNLLMTWATPTTSPEASLIGIHNSAFVR